MNSLHIPTRERLKGQNIRCSICYKKGKGYCASKGENGKTAWKCKSTGKHLNTCNSPDSQKFISALYNPFSKKSDIIVQHDIRDFDEFRNKHNELLNIEKEIKRLYRIGKTTQAMAIVKSFRKQPKENEEQIKQQEQEDKSREINITKETYLEMAMFIYTEYLYGRKGEDWEKRPKTKKAIQNYTRTLEKFHECLSKRGFNPEVMQLETINKKHLHTWVREVKSWGLANKTENDYLNNVSIFFNWCSERGAGEICNALGHVEKGKTKGDTTMISFKDFKDMIALITPENGKGLDSWICGKTGKPKSKFKNFYRDWLPDGFWLSLLLGGRGDDMVDFKWNEIKHRKTEDGHDFYHIELFNHKHFRGNNEEKEDFIVAYKQTYEILLRLGLKDKIGTDQYVIAPEVENRKRIKRILEDSFRFFWRLKTGSKENDVKFKTLRSTYITISENLAGSQSEMIRRHTKTDTTRKHYFNRSFAVSNMFGQDFFDLKTASNS